jgi:hypothetical protein
MQKHIVTLWAPDLLNPLRLKEAGAEWTGLDLPNLRTLCGKADIFKAKIYPQKAFFKQANYLFHQAIDLPIAAMTASVEVPFDAKAFWLHVDPAQMVADRDTLVLIPPEHLAITEAESRALCASFNAHFAQDSVQLEFANAQRWYLRMAQAVDIQTTALVDASYQSVNLLYPKGNAASYWHTLMNEVQMLFYTHPVNELRRQQNRPEINSVWVWGEGQLQDLAVKARVNAKMWSQKPYLMGLAKQAQAQSAATPNSYQAWLESTNDNDHSTQHLIHLDALSDALPNATQAEWLAHVEWLEAQWLMGLQQGLAQQRLDSVLLVLGDGQQYHLQPKHLKRFWRLKKSLKQFA